MRDEELEQEKRAIYPTFDGIDVEIVKVANSALFQLVNAKGGVLSDGLKGMFTTPQKAKEQLETYNIQGKQNEERKAQEAKAKEEAVQALIEAPATPENYVAQRKAQIKQEKAASNG